MELNAQIKKYRNELSLSQEELAEKIFVSRQSISNWETGKTYPDIKSLLLLSEVFGVSLDTLVKGDIETMKKEINSQELTQFNRDSAIYAVLLMLMLLLPIPLAHFLGWWGMAVYLVLGSVALYFALRLEKYKKKHNIHTYKEILAFTEGKSLNEIEQAREEGKRPYQKILMAVCSAVIGLAVTALIAFLFNL